MRKKILVCGSRGKFKNYREKVKKVLSETHWGHHAISPQGSEFKSDIIEGCCNGSADEYAEEWVKENDSYATIKHFPSTRGNYLRRNKEMVKEVGKDGLVIAFWDGYSYGTAHTIAWATKLGIPVRIILLRGEDE